MKISIAMATYNGAQYIQKQLESFIDQTIKPYEIIISDDCSTDNTLKIINDFREKVPFKVNVIVNSKNLGYTGNFNSALMNTTGDVIFLSDQDDVWYPNKIEHMLNVMEGKPNNLVYMNDALLTDSNLNSKHLTKYGQIKSAGLSDSKFVMGCCCMVRRELLNFCLPIPFNLKGHDDWIVGIAEGIQQKYIDKTTLQYYRRHEYNESNFIANRVKKVTKKDIWVAEFKKLFFNKNERIIKANEFIEQHEIFLEALINIKENIPLKYKEKFDKLLDQQNKKIELLRLRYILRNSNIFSRIFKVIYFYFYLYNKETRLQNMLRDLIS